MDFIPGFWLIWQIIDRIAFYCHRIMVITILYTVYTFYFFLEWYLSLTNRNRRANHSHVHQRRPPRDDNSRGNDDEPQAPPANNNMDQK